MMRCTILPRLKIGLRPSGSPTQTSRSYFTRPHVAGATPLSRTVFAAAAGVLATATVLTYSIEFVSTIRLDFEPESQAKSSVTTSIARALGKTSGQPPALDQDGATKKLREEETKQPFYAGHGRIGSAHIVRLASNHPVEDQFALLTNPSPWAEKTFGMSFFGVYDGHAGWATSIYLREHLIPWVSQTVEKLPKTSTPSAITSAIKAAFLQMDDKIVQTAVKKAKSVDTPADPSVIAALAPAVAGSCALMAAFEPQNSLLRVACVGDSRAVLGQYSSETNSFEATPLSEDQSGSSKSEIARLDAEHPNEPAMLDGLNKQGRIFGLMCTRAFGDHRWKLDEDTIKSLQENYFGSGPRPGMKTPPYVSAKPEITETVVRSGQKNQAGENKPSFVILATDGLWDHMSSEDAVHCVDAWLDAKCKAKSSANLLTSKEVTAGDVPSGSSSKDKPFQLDQGYAIWQYKREWLTVEDDNAASHLVRNALGGKNKGFFRGVMSTYNPMSRNVRDDITVQVIFFEEAPGV